VRDESAFAAAALTAARGAHERIVTLGIKPERPETGYGYIEAGGDLAHGVREIARFVEKPDRATAEKYVSGGRHSWNAGIFLFRPDVLIGEMRRYAPEILEATGAALDHAARQSPFVALDLERFGRCPSESIDVAVMEKTTLGAMVECDIGWADVGSWSELWRIGPLDSDGNRLHGNVVVMDTTGTLALSEGPLVAALGVQDLVIVASKDAVLVTTKDRAQDVKHLAVKVLEDAPPL
jgi:mannose-1-phosphate guanylyltransferase/mannose-6-phosphate isomerase